LHFGQTLCKLFFYCAVLAIAFYSVVHADTVSPAFLAVLLVILMLANAAAFAQFAGTSMPVMSADPPALAVLAEVLLLWWLPGTMVMTALAAVVCLGSMALSAESNCNCDKCSDLWNPARRLRKLTPIEALQKYEIHSTSMSTTFTLASFAARKNEKPSNRNFHITTFRNEYGGLAPYPYER
jgi:hypothetical protein